jgi:predicted Fe-S protein YdhL (DUF1289 family)
MGKRTEIKSPCIKICEIDNNTGFCKGCFRTLDEISNWVFINDDERNEILHNVKLRKKTRSKK